MSNHNGEGRIETSNPFGKAVSLNYLVSQSYIWKSITRGFRHFIFKNSIKESSVLKICYPISAEDIRFKDTKKDMNILYNSGLQMKLGVKDKAMPQRAHSRRMQTATQTFRPIGRVNDE